MLTVKMNKSFLFNITLFAPIVHVKGKGLAEVSFISLVLGNYNIIRKPLVVVFTPSLFTLPLISKVISENVLLRLLLSFSLQVQF